MKRPKETPRYVKVLRTHEVIQEGDLFVNGQTRQLGVVGSYWVGKACGNCAQPVLRPVLVPEESEEATWPAS